MLQQIIVYLVFAVCVGFVIFRVGRRLVSGSGKDACDGCSADCKLRGIKNRNKEKCQK